MNLNMLISESMLRGWLEVRIWCPLCKFLAASLFLLVTLGKGCLARGSFGDTNEQFVCEWNRETQ